MTSGLHNIPDQPQARSTKYQDADSGPKARAPRVGLRGGRSKSFSLAEKLAARTVAQPNGCWEVQGCPNRKGYFVLSVGSAAHPPYVRVVAHRFAWEQANGRKVPDGLQVMHRCDNPACVNPAHLDVGTGKQNVQDSIAKGRFKRHLTTGVRLDGSPARRAAKHRLLLERVPSRQLPIRGEVA